MRRIQIAVLSMAAAAGLTWQAKADFVPVLEVGSNDHADFFQEICGDDVTLLFKLNVGGGIEGVLKDHYSDFFTISFIDKYNAKVSWDMSGSGYDLCAIAWKDGTLTSDRGTLGFYWASVESNEGEANLSTKPDFVGGFSHISFYGSNNGTIVDDDHNSRVPDGGTTAMLLGLSLSSLGLFRRGKGEA